MLGWVKGKQEAGRNDHTANSLVVLVTKNEKVDTEVKWSICSLLVCVAFLYSVMCVVEVTRKKQKLTYGS